MSLDALDRLAPGWIKLSTWSVLHFIAKTLKDLVKNLIALVPVAYGLFQLDSTVMVAGAVLGLISLIIFYAVLRYLFFSYQISDDSVLVREGIIFKKQLNLAFSRIQNVTFEHPFYFRALGLVTVKIDSAGSSTAEVFLSALETEQAQAIRRDILAHKATTEGQGGMDADRRVGALADQDGELLITRSLPDLVLHGLTNNRAWIVLGGVGAIYGQFSGTLNEYFVARGIDVGELVGEQSLLAMMALLISAIIVSVIIVAALSVLGSIFAYYDFTLLGSDKSFTVHRGLFTRHEIHMQKSRIQNIYFHQGWLDLVLGRVNLIFEQISHSLAQASKADKKLLVPTITMSQALSLSREVLPSLYFDRLEFTPISKRYFYKNAAIWTCIYWLPALLVVFQEPQALSLLAYVSVIWSWHVGVWFMIWKRQGIAVDGGMVVIRKGIIGVDYIVIPAFKLQKVRFTQSPLMKRHALGSITLNVASRSTRIPFIDEHFARRVVDHCLYQVESTSRAWM